jgi:hypothetical protein
MLRNGEEATEIFRSTKIILAVLDVVMPRKGQEAFEEMYKQTRDSSDL